MVRRAFVRFASYIYRDFPARKFFGCLFASLGGAFALCFLGRALWEWAAVPEGVIGVIGLLTGGFGAYVASSSYEAARRNGAPDGDDADRGDRE